MHFIIKPVPTGELEGHVELVQMDNTVQVLMNGYLIGVFAGTQFKLFESGIIRSGLLFHKVAL